MGNIRSKNTLFGILEKWEKSSPHENEHQTYSCKINSVSIHRLNGEYYVENNFATIGPMTKEQLLMISRKNPKFKLRTVNNHLESNGDSPELQLVNKNLTVSLKTCSRNFLHPENISTINESDLYIPKDKSQKIKNNLSIENSGEEKFSKLPTDVSKEVRSICSPDDKSSITNISTNIELCSEYQKSPVTKRNSNINKISKISKCPNNGNRHLRSDSKPKKQHSKSLRFTIGNFEIFPDIQKQIRPTNFDKKVLQKYGKLKNRKSIITTTKELNLSSKKKLLKKQFNQKLIEKYKNMEMLNKIQKEVELNSTGDNCLAKSDYQPTAKTIGFSEPINNEKFRYTAFVKADTINWCKQKALIRRLKTGFEEKFGCVVNLGDEVIEFRGSVIYTVNIEGKDKISVIKCRNSLPFELKANLILSKNTSEECNSVITEKWKTLTPYHPKLIQNLGSKSVKLSY